MREFLPLARRSGITEVRALVETPLATRVVCHIPIDRAEWDAAPLGSLVYLVNVWESPNGPEDWHSLIPDRRIVSGVSQLIDKATRQPTDYFIVACTQGSDNVRDPRRGLGRVIKLGQQEIFQRVLFPRLKITIETNIPATYGFQLETTKRDD